MNITF